ncbi:hypothetical protein FQR65_LT03462 [Abscondita terminalis]|nr:hypothetical protein FQR65_LT03462 [Abscondita terminalis]
MRKTRCQSYIAGCANTVTQRTPMAAASRPATDVQCSDDEKDEGNLKQIQKSALPENNPSVTITFNEATLTIIHPHPSNNIHTKITTRNRLSIIGLPQNRLPETELRWVAHAGQLSYPALVNLDAAAVAEETVELYTSTATVQDMTVYKSYGLC